MNRFQLYEVTSEGEARKERARLALAAADACGMTNEELEKLAGSDKCPCGTVDCTEEQYHRGQDE
jgi:hypothetical protein